MPTDWRQFYGIPDPMPDDYLDGDSIHRLDEILKGIILDPDAESRAERVAEWIALGNQIEAGLVLLGEEDGYEERRYRHHYHRPQHDQEDQYPFVEFLSSGHFVTP